MKGITLPDEERRPQVIGSAAPAAHECGADLDANHRLERWCRLPIVHQVIEKISPDGPSSFSRTRQQKNRRNSTRPEGNDYIFKVSKWLDVVSSVLCHTAQVVQGGSLGLQIPRILVQASVLGCVGSAEAPPAQLRGLKGSAANSTYHSTPFSFNFGDYCVHHPGLEACSDNTPKLPEKENQNTWFHSLRVKTEESVIKGSRRHREKCMRSFNHAAVNRLATADVHNKLDLFAWLSCPHFFA